MSRSRGGKARRDEERKNGCPDESECYDSSSGEAVLVCTTDCGELESISQ